MSSSSVAKRYATALFQLSKEHQLLDQMEANQISTRQNRTHPQVQMGH